MLILDQPDPLGGVVIEGPIAREFGKDVAALRFPHATA